MGELLGAHDLDHLPRGRVGKVQVRQTGCESEIQHGCTEVCVCVCGVPSTDVEGRPADVVAEHLQLQRVTDKSADVAGSGFEERERGGESAAAGTTRT